MPIFPFRAFFDTFWCIFVAFLKLCRSLMLEGSFPIFGLLATLVTSLEHADAFCDVVFFPGILKVPFAPVPAN